MVFCSFHPPPNTLSFGESKKIGEKQGLQLTNSLKKHKKVFCYLNKSSYMFTHCVSKGILIKRTKRFKCFSKQFISMLISLKFQAAGEETVPSVTLWKRSRGPQDGSPDWPLSVLCILAGTRPRLQFCFNITRGAASHWLEYRCASAGLFDPQILLSRQENRVGKMLP